MKIFIDENDRLTIETEEGHFHFFLPNQSILVEAMENAGWDIH